MARLFIYLSLLNVTLAFLASKSSPQEKVVQKSHFQEVVDTSSSFDGHADIGAVDTCNSFGSFTLDRRSALVAGASLASFGTLLMSSGSARAISASPPPNVLLNSSDGKTISMPLIAYSFYKTSAEQAPRGLALALRAGIRHFDMATDYGNFDDVSPILKQYWNTGKIDWKFEDEKEELLQLLDNTKKAAAGGSRTKMNGKKQRRQDIFLTYKLSNDEQSTDPSSIKDKVSSLLSQLDTSYLDLVSLHSPLPGKERRTSTYKTLLDLKEEGLVRSVGVCNFGLCHLKELSASGFPLPAVNQLEISPFNTHGPIVKYCKENGVQVSCATWSKLSSVSGPVEQWAKLGELAKDKGVTKAQILVRWALQKGFGCAPRSGTGSKLEVRLFMSDK
jgi:diketogulonate reductase-like aldo/keto reductase